MVEKESIKKLLAAKSNKNNHCKAGKESMKKTFDPACWQTRCKK